jgi:small GTP-binding protein
MTLNFDRVKKLSQGTQPGLSMSSVIDAKIVFLGTDSVGKTCIVSRSKSNDFAEEVPHTLGACYAEKAVEVGDTTVKLQIWDTAGLERYRGMIPMYYLGSRVALLVFSVADAASLGHARGWAEELKGQPDPMPTLFLVGNKSDLPDRKVQTQEGENLANELNATYFEVSAKTGNGIDDLFRRVVDLALKKLEG